VCHVPADFELRLIGLPWRWASALLARYRDGYDDAETGAMLRVTSQTIGQICNAGVRRMAKNLAQFSR
jgi:DNA-directed RNA polymerase specialized sigma24 family protein